MTCTLMNSMELLKLCKCRYHSLHHFVMHNECSIHLGVVNATKLRGVTGYFEYIGKIQNISLGLHTYTEVLVSE